VIGTLFALVLLGLSRELIRSPARRPGARPGRSAQTFPLPEVPSPPCPSCLGVGGQDRRVQRHALWPVVAPETAAGRPASRSQAGAVRIRRPRLVNGNAQMEFPLPLAPITTWWRPIA